MASNPPVTAQLAEFVATLPRAAIPARGRQRAILALLDWTGVTLPATRQPETITLRESVMAHLQMLPGNPPQG